jgi:hypothetical protein
MDGRADVVEACACGAWVCLLVAAGTTMREHRTISGKQMKILTSCLQLFLAYHSPYLIDT